jgi:hypothetical protein
MMSRIGLLLSCLFSMFRSYTSVRLENLALRHQVAVYKQSMPRPKLSQSGKPGRPPIDKEVCQLIENMWQANPTWGSPRIVGELRKLGIHVAKSTVEKYRPHNRKPPSPTWKAFLANHVTDIVACDFFTVPTVNSYLSYYHRFRTHLSLEMDCPEPRTIQPPEWGSVRSVPEVSGLHYHDERIAA